MPLAGTTLYLTRTFAAPRHKVFEAWTRPEVISQWFAASEEHVPSVAEVDLRVGGSYRIGMKHIAKGTEHIATGVYKEIVPDERLVFTWSWEENPNENETLITIEFRDANGSTEMHFRHERFATVKLRDDHQHGWAGCLERLARAMIL